MQITNQMITACKSYVSESGRETVWSLPPETVVGRLDDCIRLNSDYQKAFHQTKERLDRSDGERKFDFPEMLIFGKFDKFCRRLEKIKEMFANIEVYSHLAESKIEGLFCIPRCRILTVSFSSFSNVCHVDYLPAYLLELKLGHCNCAIITGNVCSEPNL